MTLFLLFKGHLGTCWIKEGFYSKALSKGYPNTRLINKDIRALYDLRIDADYSPSSVIDAKDAKGALKIAANMLSLVKKRIK